MKETATRSEWPCLTSRCSGPHPPRRSMLRSEVARVGGSAELWRWATWGHAMSIGRRWLIAAALLVGAFAAEVVLGGCARVTSQVRVRGLVVDPFNSALPGAEVYAAYAGLPVGDQALASLRDDVESDVPPEFRECRFTRTDADGRFTLILRIGQCRSIGPVSSTMRALFGESKPSLDSYAIVARASEFQWWVVEPASGNWVITQDKPRPRWIYQIPPIKMVPGGTGASVNP